MYYEKQNLLRDFEKANRGMKYRLRPHQSGDARSRQILVAKQGRAWLVLGWETAWEYNTNSLTYISNAVDVAALSFEKNKIFSLFIYSEKQNLLRDFKKAKCGRKYFLRRRLASWSTEPALTWRESNEGLIRFPYHIKGPGIDIICFNTQP